MGKGQVSNEKINLIYISAEKYRGRLGFNYFLKNAKLQELNSKTSRPCLL